MNNSGTLRHTATVVGGAVWLHSFNSRRRSVCVSIGATLTRRLPPPPGQRLSASTRVVTPDYFVAQGIPLRQGRVFNEQDKAGGPGVVIVNEAFARRYLPGEEPLGKRLRLGINRTEGEIVGVVGDIRGASLAQPGAPEYYIPETAVAFGDMTLVVRTTNDPASLAAALRQAVAEMDKDQPLYDLRTMDTLIARSVARQRFSMTLVGVFAVLAVLLAAIGIFSVMSSLVAQRTHEIGCVWPSAPSRETSSPWLSATV